jgi:hypothetical protein
MYCCLQVIKAGGVVKDAAWIAGVHEEIVQDAVKVLGGSPSRFVGFIMDNTAANRAAMRTLKEAHPTWLLLGCSAHALALLVKDFCEAPRSERKPDTPVKAGSTKLHVTWTSRTAKAVLKISNAISDSERVRALYTRVAKERKIAYSIATHAPTRFASIMFIARDVLRCRPALQDLVLHREWAAVSASLTCAEEFKALVLGER